MVEIQHVNSNFGCWIKSHFLHLFRASYSKNLYYEDAFYD